MPILTDVSGTLFASLHVDLRNSNGKVSKEYIRHLVFNSLGHYNKKFSREYGEQIICCDFGSWRKRFFPLYKWVRHNIDNDSKIDWETVGKYMEEILREVHEHLPFPLVRQRYAEGDDVISVLANHYARRGEKVMIVSGDKDMVFMTKNALIKQYRPVQREMYEVEDSLRFEFDLIMRGDKDDGVPSIRCEDDFLKEAALSKQRGDKVPRAPAISKKFLDGAWEACEGDKYSPKLKGYLGDEMYARFLRNRKLISLDEVPDVLVKAIMEQHDNMQRNPLMKTQQFFIANRMQVLAKNLKMFEPKRPHKLGALFGG